jgi:hypothetical protein
VAVLIVFRVVGVKLHRNAGVQKERERQHRVKKFIRIFPDQCPDDPEHEGDGEDDEPVPVALKLCQCFQFITPFLCKCLWELV